MSEILVITIRDPAGQAGVYDALVREMNRVNWALRTSAFGRGQGCSNSKLPMPLAGLRSRSVPPFLVREWHAIEFLAVDTPLWQRIVHVRPNGRRGRGAQKVVTTGSERAAFSGSF